MNMQDNEFDDLFRNKLDNFAAEPPGKVWAGIDNELGKKDTGNRGFFILKIAASIIVLLTAGLLFIPKGQKDQHQKPNRVVKSNSKPDVIKLDQESVTTPVTKKAQLAVAPVQHNRTTSSPIVTKRHVINEPGVQKAIPNNSSQETIAKVEPTPVIASEKPDVKIPTVTIDTAKRLIAKADVPDVVAPVKVNPAIVAQAPVNNVPKATVKRRGIHNFGELVNLVVAKVDKRKDKAIEFSDTDDDSSITGINIGPFKIKKGNNKD